MMQYKAHLSIVDNAIVTRTFMNTVGPVLWTRISAGVYRATLAEAYGAERIHLPARVLDIDLEADVSAIVGLLDSSTIEISAQNSQGDHVDWLSYSIEFEIYPTSYLS